MKLSSIKKAIIRTGAVCLSAIMLFSAAFSASAASKQTTPSGDTVVRISNPDGKPGEADGLIGDREVGYGWSMAERDGWLYIGGWRNTVGAVIKAYLEPAVIASGQMDSETMWKLVNTITNAEVPYPSNENGGVLVKMNRQNPGEFEIIAEMNIINTLKTIYDNDDLKKIDMKQKAEEYLSGIGLREEEIADIKTNLSADYAEY